MGERIFKSLCAQKGLVVIFSDMYCLTFKGLFLAKTLHRTAGTRTDCNSLDINNEERHKPQDLDSVYHMKLCLYPPSG